MTRSILFLDFDAVLHPTGVHASKKPFARLPLRRAMLREARCGLVQA